jgi:NADP-dependent aldehyde dehydrogenase
MILQRQINERAEPIPFYGELGSVNPQFILEDKLANEATELAQALVASLMMAQGQFCTSPGIWAYVMDKNSLTFEKSAAQAISKTKAGVMLTPAIAASYNHTVSQWQSLTGVECLAQGQVAEPEQAHFCRAVLFATDLATFKADQTLHEEVFGSSALIVRCKNHGELMEFISLLKGNLTASIHASEKDLQIAQRVALAAAHKVGRLIYNQMPTGVEVCAAMNHGGPFPASTQIRTTSVGSEAIKRFQRPICYQNMPNELLPSLLKR